MRESNAVQLSHRPTWVSVIVGNGCHLVMVRARLTHRMMNGDGMAGSGGAWLAVIHISWHGIASLSVCLIHHYTMGVNT